MLITYLIFVCGFAVSYRCFTRNYVMIFQAIICRFSKSKNEMILNVRG